MENMWGIKHQKKYDSIYKRSAEYRNFVLLCEIGALLHDIGKLSRLFVLSKAKGTNIKDFHGQVLFTDYNKMPQNVREFLFAPLWMFFEDVYCENIPEKRARSSLSNLPLDISSLKICSKKDLENFRKRFAKDPLSVYSSPLINAPTIKKIPLNIALSHFVCAHHGCNRCLLQNYLHKCCVFSDAAQDSSKALRVDKHPLIRLLKTVDHLDASNPSNAGKQEMFNLYRDNFFFGETKLPLERFDEMRFAFYNELSVFLQDIINAENAQSKNRPFFPQVAYMRKMPQINSFVKHLIEKYFTYALSETRRFGNDITLSDHVFAVSSFFKAFLYAYLVFNKEMPNSFFSVRFRLLRAEKLRTASNKETTSNRKNADTVKFILENEIACCNEVAKTDNYRFFLVPVVKKGGVFVRFLQDTLSKSLKTAFSGEKLKIELLPVNDFTGIFEGTTLCGKSLSGVLEKFSKLKVKNFSDISVGYTEKDAVYDVKKVVYFALLRKKERLFAKIKSSKKHLSNLYNGSIYDEKNLVKYFRKEREVQLLEKHLNAFVSMERVKEMYGWNSSKDAEGAVYDFFNTVLSPVRPPSPVDMSFYFLREYNKLHSFKKLAERFLIQRPLVLGRVFALFRTLKVEFCAKTKND